MQPDVNGSAVRHRLARIRQKVFENLSQLTLIPCNRPELRLDVQNRAGAFFEHD